MSLNLSEWFHAADDYPTPREIEFLDALFAHAPKWSSLGVSEDHVLMQRDDTLLTIAFDVSDREYNCVLRTLRIDFYGTRVLVGPDETHQLVTDLNAKNPDVITFEDIGGTPKDFANFAVRWLLWELSRPIERHEWVNSLRWHRRWILADTGKCISCSDSRNRMRTELGKPDRVSVVRPSQDKLS